MSFSHAGGIIETIAVTRSRWSSVTRVATVWSSRAVGLSGRAHDGAAAAAAVTWAMRFFLSVLSSPLCARYRNGWPSSGAGGSLVENRVWK